MIEIFESVDKFFTSVGRYLTYNGIFITFAALFLFTVLCVFISTSQAYESRLIKAIDMLNNYFLDNPQITEENLVAFNQKMKSRKVPKQLRKQWQQFVLYREDKASRYMSFETCVSNPIKNSTYTRDMKVMNILAYIFAFASLILNAYFTYDTQINTVLQRVLLCPVLILLVNYVVTIFLDIRHNAIVSDLHQNYQYFEVNIDKATQTIPEYVDYEVLFDRNEIKRGIPILYAYLQKRAEEEKRELERARLKNVEHEKFNFDEAGVAGSLVLERAMQEAENYIAERKKYNEDTEQINADITQEETNYREITKEYNRQMQVSKETFANFKAQLEEVSSSIEANYLKKQQQQELDRQRNLERDFDTATERHKKIIESYQSELDAIDQFRTQSKHTLEDAMMSEFATYGEKVYDLARKAAEENEKENIEKAKNRIKELEERLASINQELESVYSQNHILGEKLSEAQSEDVQQSPLTKVPMYAPQSLNYKETDSKESSSEQGVDSSDIEDVVNKISTEQENESIKFEGVNNSKDEQKRKVGRPKKEVKEAAEPKKGRGRPKKEVTPEAKKRGRPRKEVAPAIQEQPAVKKGRGRPRKEDISEEPKRKVGRPKKEANEVVEPKKGRGRPKKEVAQEAKKRGRPRKEESSINPEQPVVKKGRGRPRKEEISEESKPQATKPKKEVKNVAEPKKGKGRPKKNQNPKDEIQDIDAFLKELDEEIAKENAKIEESQKELEKNSRISRRRKR